MNLVLSNVLPLYSGLKSKQNKKSKPEWLACMFFKNINEQQTTSCYIPDTDNKKTNKTNSVAFSPQANYTDRHLSTKFSANFCG
jgi:hypothetical protein